MATASPPEECINTTELTLKNDSAGKFYVMCTLPQCLKIKVKTNVPKID